MLIPHPVGSRWIGHRFLDHLQAEVQLLLNGARLVVELNCEAREVAHEYVEDLLDEVGIEFVDFGVL